MPTEPQNKTDTRMKPYRALVILPMLTQASFALSPLSEAFTATSLNTTRWLYQKQGGGKLTQSGGRLNFTTQAPLTDDDYGILTLRNNRPGFNESWQVVLDVANVAGKGGDVALGLSIANAADPKDNVNLEFYGAGSGGGFNFIGITDDVDDASKDIGVNPGVSKGSIRVSFSSVTKLFTFWYDRTGSADGYQWARLCTFSPTGQGGSRSGNWKMNPGSGSFIVRIFGYADLQSVASGKVSFDNFSLKAGG